MLNIRQISRLSVLVVVAVSAGTSARALTQEEQQLEAAQRAYEESAELVLCESDEEDDEVAESAEIFRDALIELLNEIGEPAP